MRCATRTNCVSKAELLSSYDAWLRSFPWVQWGTLTFRSNPSLPKAVRLFHSWVDEIERRDGTKDFRWVRVTETGAFNDNLHFHVLVGGLQEGSKYPPMLHWERIAGEADIHYYDPHLGGVAYLLKEVEPGRDFAIEFRLPSANEPRAK